MRAELSARKVPAPDYFFPVTDGESIGVYADRQSAIMAQNRDCIETDEIRVVNNLRHAEAMVGVANEPGFRASCYAFGVLDGGLGFAMPIRSWQEGDQLSLMHPDIVFRVFSFPIESQQFEQERASHTGGLAFDYMRSEERAAGILRRENAFGGSTRGVFSGPVDWENGGSMDRQPDDEEVVFVGEHRGSRPRVDSTMSEESEESVVILPGSGSSTEEVVVSAGPGRLASYSYIRQRLTDDGDHRHPSREV